MKRAPRDLATGRAQVLRSPSHEGLYPNRRYSRFG